MTRGVDSIQKGMLVHRFVDAYLCPRGLVGRAFICLASFRLSLLCGRASTANCAELQAAAEATVTSGDILGQLVQAEIACDDW